MIDMSKVDEGVVEHLIERLVEEVEDMFDDNASQEEVLIALGRMAQAVADSIDGMKTRH
jgi:hypothetical protein